MHRKSPKIAIGPAEIAGYGENLAAGFRKIGVDARCYYRSPYTFTARETENPFPSLLAQRVESAGLKGNGRSPLTRIPARLLHRLLSFILLIRIITTCDHLISLGGGVFLGTWEWRLARWCGCRVTVVFLGSESRPCYLGGNIVGRNRQADTGEIRRLTAQQKQRVRKVQSLADHVISCEIIAHFLFKDYFDFFQIGFPRHVPAAPLSDDDEFPESSGEPVRILHAPSNPAAKGSAEWRTMIGELMSEGIRIQYEELTGVPNREVMEKVAQCDFVVDELWADTPLGGLTTEAWLCGKPAVVGGYAQKQLEPMRALGAPLDCYVNPADAKDMIRKLCLDAAYRRQQGKMGRNFILEHYAAEKVAERYLRIFEGASLPGWSMILENTTYVHGIAFPEDELLHWLRRYVTEEGAAALHLEDKPALEQRVLDFINADGGTSAPRRDAA